MPARWPPSAYALIAANAVPLVGVLAFHWSVFAVVLLYWFENAIVGGFNVLRMLTADPGDAAVWLGKGCLIPFFCLHYGMFTAIHGELVLAFFGGNTARGLSPVRLFTAASQAGIVYGVVFLFLSHAFSFVHNYLMGGEFRHVNLPKLMAQPYTRVMILHFTILFGGFVIVLAGSPLPALVLLVALKTIIDLRAHLAERAKLAVPLGAAQPGPAPGL